MLFLVKSNPEFSSQALEKAKEKDYYRVVSVRQVVLWALESITKHSGKQWVLFPLYLNVLEFSLTSSQVVHWSAEITKVYDQRKIDRPNDQASEINSYFAFCKIVVKRWIHRSVLSFAIGNYFVFFQVFDKILSINGFIESIYHSLRIFNSHWQERKQLAETFRALHLSLLVYDTGRNSALSNSVRPPVSL